MSDHISSVILCFPVADDRTKYLRNFPLFDYNVTDVLMIC